jgi:hypothetical protein
LDVLWNLEVGAWSFFPTAKTVKKIYFPPEALDNPEAPGIALPLGFG